MKRLSVSGFGPQNFPPPLDAPFRGCEQRGRNGRGGRERAAWVLGIGTFRIRTDRLVKET